MIKFYEALRNSKVMSVIMNDLERGMLSHAYIIYSPDDKAMDELFTLISCAVYCKNDICLECVECQRVLSLNHSDIKHIQSASGKQISVDDIKNLIDDTVLTSYEGGYKLYFIHSAEKLSIYAQNKLLKTLEEPISNNVCIIMGVGIEGAILDTIKSRARKIYLDYFNAEVIAGSLTGNDNRVAIAASCACGMLGQAERILADEGFIKNYLEVLNIFKDMKKSNDVLKYSTINAFANENISKTLDIFDLITRDMMAVSTGNSELTLSSWIQDEQYRLTEEFSLAAMVNITERINIARKRLAANCNIGAVVENLLLGILEVKYKCRLL